MTSEANKAWKNMRLLHTATEKLHKDRDASPVQERKESVDTEEEETSASLEMGEEANGGDEGQGGRPSPTHLDPQSEGVDKERLAQLRSHLQAQFSVREQQEDASPGTQLMALVGKMIHGEGAGEALPANSAGGSGGHCPVCGQCSNPAGCSNGFPAEVEKALQRELAVLKGEVTASIESMKREVAEELSSLREALRAYNEQHYLQTAELSPLEELDENVADLLKGGPHRMSQGGYAGGKISLEEKFKSRSVPTLHPLPISSRSQAIIRAMSTTMSAKNSFIASLSRSNSDPVEPMQVKSAVFPPPIPKLATKKHPPKMMLPPSTRTYASGGKSSGKMASRTIAPHPPHGDSEGKPH